jgi:hypothetical protein
MSGIVKSTVDLVRENGIVSTGSILNGIELFVDGGAAQI